MRMYDNYSQYRDLWNKSIPSHWEVLPMYAVAQEKSICNCTELPLLSVYLDVGVIPFSAKAEKRTNVTSTDLSKYQRVDIGDFVLNNQQAWRGSVGVSFDTGIVSPAYIVLSMNDRLNSRYANYLFRSRIMVDQYLINSKSVGSIQRNIYWSALKRTRVIIPPIEEQNQIVKFLDWKVSAINKLISVKKNRVTAYKELRKAVIDQGILHGFKSTDTKDSGIYWLGEIPESWEVLPLKRICRANASIADIVKTKENSELVTFLPMENVTETGEIDCSIKKKVADVRTGFSSFAKGDVVVAKITPCFENGKGACLDDLDTDIGFGTTEFINLRPFEIVLSKYLYMITMTRPFRKLGEEVMTGSAGQKRVSVNYIKNFTLGIPSVEEQKSILAEIERRLVQIDKAIEIERGNIKNLQELKARIISDAVTGKIDVRSVDIPEYEYIEDQSDEEADEEDIETEEQED
jgi:restriction modification system DNA specificity domain protein